MRVVAGRTVAGGAVLMREQGHVGRRGRRPCEVALRQRRVTRLHGPAKDKEAKAQQAVQIPSDGKKKRRKKKKKI